MVILVVVDSVAGIILVGFVCCEIQLVNIICSAVNTSKALVAIRPSMKRDGIGSTRRTQWSCSLPQFAN